VSDNQAAVNYAFCSRVAFGILIALVAISLAEIKRFK